MLDPPWSKPVACLQWWSKPGHLIYGSGADRAEADQGAFSSKCVIGGRLLGRQRQPPSTGVVLERCTRREDAELGGAAEEAKRGGAGERRVAALRGEGMELCGVCLIRGGIIGRREAEAYVGRGNLMQN
jgi:hypothetical protein